MVFDGATKDPMQQPVRDTLIAGYLGREPSYTREQFAKVRDMLGQTAVGIATIAQ